MHKNPLRSVHGLALGLLLLSTSNLQAALVDIGYNLSGGNVYQYTVYNNLPNELTDFVVFFPTVSGPGEYFNLGAAVLDSPGAWSVLPAEPSAVLLNGFVEWYTAGAGIPTGGLLAGFAVSFDYAGIGLPGSQFFEVYDASFNKITDGWTFTVIPEPASALVGALVLGGWAAVARRHRKSR